MAPSKPPKKNETIEVRLSEEAKAAFMARCRQEQRTASEAIRLFIDDQLDARRTIRRRTPYWRIILAGIVGTAVGAGAAAPSLARDADGTRRAFNQLDRDHDGILTYREFRGR